MEINPRASLVSRKEILVQAPPDVVWTIHTDVNGWKEWQPDIRTSESGGALKAGLVFTWTSGGFVMTSIIEELIPRRRIGWTGKSFGSRARHVWMFEPREGGTIVKTEESMEGWFVSLLKPLMPNLLDRSLDVWLRSLKIKAEGKAASRHVIAGAALSP